MTLPKKPAAPPKAAKKPAGPPKDFVSMMEAKQAMLPPEEEEAPVEEPLPGEEEALPEDLPTAGSLTDVLAAALEKQAKIKQLLTAILQEL